MGDNERRVKRSRFDQTEPEPRKASRFDRRSRSPSSRQTESRRSRSPIGKDSRSPASSDKRSASLDPAAAAGECPQPQFWCIYADFIQAAAAAKINAELQARKGIQHADVPPIRSVSPHPRNNPSDPLIRYRRLQAPFRRPPLPQLAKAQATSMAKSILPMVTILKILKSMICEIAIH